MLLNLYKPTHQSLTEGFLKTYSLNHLPESQRNQFATTMETCGIVLERNEAIVLEAARRKQTPNKGGDTKGKNRDKGKPDKEAPSGAAFAQHGGKGGGASGVTCFCCGKKGHTCDKCEHKNNPPEKWFNPSKFKRYSMLHGWDVQLANWKGTGKKALHETIKKGYRVQFDSDKMNAFVVTSPRGLTEIYCHHPNGLYVRPLINSPPEFDDLNRDINIRAILMQSGNDANGPNHTNDNNILSGSSGLQTVEKNMEGFTDREVKAANAARAGYNIAGTPDIVKFQHAVQTGLLKNCPIIVTDIKNANAIYG
ncbi:unnamed protein product [Cylindrotheca closterium]|uniref:CCHC-type domain-containing protein n=1 Tax=Cylindrotheca closterium TaxID=2856 RepID=A0AAD2JL01_9STRA|nr:unnamed protein product [Cylindrotheca closterium]